MMACLFLRPFSSKRFLIERMFISFYLLYLYYISREKLVQPLYVTYLILEIQLNIVRFLPGFLKSNTIMCAVKVGFLKSEVAGSVSCSDSWNPWHCGALLSGISQMVGNDGALSIILMDCESGHIVVIL